MNGLVFDSGSIDKYQGCVTNGCTNPFIQGIAVGDENN
jgi:hypothetical protein